MPDTNTTSRVAAVKDALRVSDVVGSHVALKWRGREATALCPFHDERSPSFTVVDAKGFFYCFGCGAHGDQVGFVMQYENIGFMNALARLEAKAGSIGAEPSPAIRGSRRRIHEPGLDRDPDDEAGRIRAARTIWNSARRAARSPGAVYLAGRGIGIEPPPTIRFADGLLHRPSGHTLPALVCAVQDVDRRLVGVWRIWIEPAPGGFFAKASIHPPRMGLGVAAGGAVRLGPAAKNIAACEGVETGLAIAQACPGLTVWAALSTGGLRAIRLPEIVREVVVCADHDKIQLGKRGSAVGAGEDAVLALCARLKAENRVARIAMPARPGTDWNDVLRSTTA